jgi:cellulose biosynthesis protein BcsQ
MTSVVLFAVLAKLGVYLRTSDVKIAGLLGALLVLVILLLIVVVNRYVRKNFGVKFKETKNVKILTFANHKGGVGKSTVAFFVGKQICNDHPNCNVLMIDCSRYNDQTRLCLRSMSDSVETLSAKRCTVDAVITDCLAPRVWYQFWKKSFDIKNFLFHAKDSVSEAPENLYVVTNCEQELSHVAGLNPEEISRVCSAIRVSLAKSTTAKMDGNLRPWIVIIDTDGGENHALTRLAIGLSDSIIIPLSADMNARDDALRLPILFDFAQKLRDQNLSNATVDYAFFNRLESHKNQTWEGLPVTPFKDVQDIMHDVKKLFEKWVLKYPKLLNSMTKPFSECMSAVRTGGTDFRKAAQDPWRNDAGNAQNDIEALTKRLMSLKPGEGTEGGRNLLNSFDASGQ